MFFTAPVPDTPMQGMAAILFGVIAPMFIVGPIILVRIFK